MNQLAVLCQADKVKISSLEASNSHLSDENKRLEVSCGKALN